jgi:hypothetical protein
MPLHQMTGTRLKKERDHTRLYKLASQGKTKFEIADTLGLSMTTFHNWLANDGKAARVWEAGARYAGTFTERQKPARYGLAAVDEEGVVQLTEMDTEIMLPALRKRSLFGEPLPKGKRIKHLRAITGLDTHVVVASLERLEVHLKIDVVEGLVFTDYFARDES